MKNKVIRFFFVITILILPTLSVAQVNVRVVDVGAGLCVLSSDTEHDRYFLYDAGRWTNNYCSDYVRSTIGNNRLSLVVISHPDSDHLGNLPTILGRHGADMILHTGYERYRVAKWREANHAIALATKDGASVINLSSVQLSNISPTYQLGDMTVEFIYGKGDWISQTKKLAENHRRNAISIIVKLTAYGKSVFFAGDTVGRHDGDRNSTCSFAEQEIVNSNKNLSADVLIAPHHGANNASSSCFLNAINPDYIVFSAGHMYKHPRRATINRIQQALNIHSSNMFRTDRGDDEGDQEWGYQRIPGCTDKAGDDDINITISDQDKLKLSIEYLIPQNDCDY